MPAEELEGEIVVGPGRFEQAEAVAGGAPNGSQVGVVGFVAGVGGLAVLLGREGMHQAGLEAGLTEGVLHGPVIVAGAFEGDDEVGQVVLLDGEADTGDGGLEVAAAMRQGSGFEEHAAVEVGEEVAGAVLGAVESDDAEVFRPGGLNAGREEAVGFLQDKGRVGLAPPCGS
jgi:hypothetical protein